MKLFALSRKSNVPPSKASSPRVERTDEKPTVCSGETDSSGSSDDLNVSSESMEESPSPKSHSLHALLQTLHLEEHPLGTIHSIQGSSRALDVFDDDDGSSCAVSCAESNHSAVENLHTEFPAAAATADDESTNKDRPHGEERPVVHIRTMEYERIEI